VEPYPVPSGVREHIVCRAVERVFNGNKAKRSVAVSLLERALGALRAYTPDDWRFTRHPSATFFISLILPPACEAQIGHERQLKLLGRTHRLSRHGVELEKRLKAFVRASASGMDPAARRAELEAMADLYLADLQEPAGEIVHELKTVYRAAEDLGNLRKPHQELLREYPHTAIVRAVKAPALYASIPNALLCPQEEDPDGFRLWARQGDCWTAPQLSAPRQHVRALFCPLTRSGPSFDEGQIWAFDNQGNIRREGAADVRAILGVRCQKPDGYRSESYWVLPTRLDALWMEHDFLYRERAHEMTPKQVQTLTVINWIRALAVATAGVAEPPKWRKRKEKR
jgi:hypothetical protein